MASRGTRRVGPVPSIKTGSSTFDRAVEATAARINQLVGHPLAGAVLVKTPLVYGLNKVAHGLGRAPTSFMWTTDRAGVVVSNAQADNPNPATTLWVVMAGDFDDCAAHLLVF